MMGLRRLPLTICASAGTRTQNLLVKSELLRQLSYGGEAQMVRGQLSYGGMIINLRRQIKLPGQNFKMCPWRDSNSQHLLRRQR